MGTRSLTLFMDGNHELCRLYRQLDGYPSGHGVDLAKVCNKTIVNGYTFEQVDGGFANGMGNLAVQAIAELSEGIQQFHLEQPGGELNDSCEYIYVVRGSVGHKPTIECTTQTGPWPFNVQQSGSHVFTGTPDQWLAGYKKD